MNRIEKKMGRAKKNIFLAILFSVATLIGGLYYFGAFGPHLLLSKATFKHLPNWQQDNQSQALLAFQRSCTTILKKSPDAMFSALPHSGTNRDWQRICNAANALVHPDKMAAQQFFETWFQPYHVSNHLNASGLFTGYYLPLLHGSITPNKQYSVPVYGVPSDLVKINLGLFHQEMSKKTLVGQLKNNVLQPYPDRAAIMQGAISKTAKVLVWSDDPLDVFFAQIQGSAVVQLPNQKQFIINYASNNGRPYTAIGKILIAKKELTKETVSMQTIRTWLLQHPEQRDNILNQNASYVFFNVLKNKDPLGTAQVPLIPERALAVDTHHIPLGAPLWLDTVAPQNTREKSTAPFQHLMVAQDTGGAIKGIVRGDVYWGAGETAAFIAGHMQSKGQYWILLPRM